MALARTPIVGALLAFARRLRFPVLFWTTLVLFLLNVVVPDAIPFVDEILLGLAALVFSRWKDERAGKAEDAGPQRT